MELFQKIPLILQFAVLLLITLYVIVSIVGRLPRFHFIWRDKEQILTPGHIVQYTVVPIGVWCVVLAAVIHSWQTGVEWMAGWEVKDLIAGPGLILLAFVLIPTGHLLLERIDTSDASKFTAWIPFVTIVTAIACLFYGAFVVFHAVERFS